MKKTVAVIVAMLAAGCAQMPGTQSGRYMQLTSPMNGKVVAQVSLPTDQGCRYMAGQMNKAEPIFACSATSQAAVLPWRATIRNTAYDFVVDIDALVKDDCESFLNSSTKDNEKTIEVLKPCHVKPS